jgi:hypothetical protein
MDTGQQPLEPTPTPDLQSIGAAPLDPTPTPPLDPTPTPSRDVVLGAVGFVQAVAKATRVAPMASAVARRERTSMYTSGAVGRMRRYGCTYSWRLHPSRQSRIGSSDSSFGQRDLCSS